MVLAVFNVLKYCEDGIISEPDIETTSGAVRYVNFLRVQIKVVLKVKFIISHPTSFKCTVTPRNEKAFGLINEERFA